MAPGSLETETNGIKEGRITQRRYISWITLTNRWEQRPLFLENRRARPVVVRKCGFKLCVVREKIRTTCEEELGINRGGNCKRNQSSPRFHRVLTKAVTRRERRSERWQADGCWTGLPWQLGVYRRLELTIPRDEAGRSVSIGAAGCRFHHAYNVRLCE